MKRLKVGLFGLNRGQEYINGFLYCDTDIVAICDFDKKACEEVVQRLGKEVKVYEKFDEFIEHQMDIVVIANYYHEHAKYSIECLKRNLHVFCECSAAVTIAECVALVRAAENSKGVFMLSENYPFMLFNQEMKRVYKDGSLGKILYAEGEYNHPVKPNDKEFYKKYISFPEHWRNYLPRAFYVTHSLAPLMYISGSIPKRVTAMPVYAPYDEENAHGRYVGDQAAIITILNDDNSVFKITGCAAFGAHGNSYRLCCEKGQIENVRGMENKMLLRYSSWAIPEGKKETNFYDASMEGKENIILQQTMHGGSDYLVVKEFVDCLKKGTKPILDVYFAVNMAMVSILAHRSLLQKGVPYDIPDLHLESERVKYEKDESTPFIGGKSENIIPCCSNPEYKPSEYQLNKYLEMIKEN